MAAAGQLIDQNVVLTGSVNSEQRIVGIIAHPVASIGTLCLDGGNAGGVNLNRPGGVVGQGGFGSQIVTGRRSSIQIAISYVKGVGTGLVARFQNDNLGIVIERNHIAGLGNSSSSAIVFILSNTQSLIDILGHNDDPVTDLQIGHISHQCNARRFGSAANCADSVSERMGNLVRILRLKAVATVGIGTSVGSITQSHTGGIRHHAGAVAAGVAAGSPAIGGRGNARRNSLTKQQEGQFGVVYVDIAGSGDGLDRVVTAQLPGVNRVLFHPLEQNVLTFHNTGRTPHKLGIAPAGVNVEHDAGHVAAQVIISTARTVRIIIAAALTVGRVAAAGVFGGSCGTQHHDIILSITAALTVGPGVLTVPGRTASPLGANGDAGIKRGNGAAAVLTVGILIHSLGIVITGHNGLLFGHQRLQRSVQSAVGRIVIRTSAGKLGQVFIGIISGVEGLRTVRQFGGSSATNAPVFDPIFGCVGVRLSNRQKAEANEHSQQKCQTAVCDLFHKTHSIFVFYGLFDLFRKTQDILNLFYHSYIPKAIICPEKSHKTDIITDSKRHAPNKRDVPGVT